MGKLKDKRMEMKLSQSQLAKKSGVKLRVLQHYEQKTKNFDHARIGTILKICLALNCKISDVMEDSGYVSLYDEYEKKIREQ